MIQMAGESTSVTNTFDNPENLIPTESTLDVAENFTYEVPAYSVTIIRIHKK